MKKLYSKPLISVEVLTLDQPIAHNCDMTLKDDIISLMEFGYFMEGENCTYNLLTNGGFDFDNDGKPDSHDTICYHSNVQQAFLS